MKMKKNLFILALAFIMFACGSSVEVDPNMKGFMDEISKNKGMIEAVEKYAADPSMETDLDIYELKEPTVTAKTEKEGKTCYKMNVKHGIIDSDCEVCWKDGKVQSVETL